MESVTLVETDRLLLRPWRDEDGVELQRLLNDPAVQGGRNLPPDRIARMAESDPELRAAREEMAGWYLPVGLAPGTQKGLAMLRSHGVAVSIASITWSFAVEHFARRLGVEHWQGTRCLTV